MDPLSAAALSAIAKSVFGSLADGAMNKIRKKNVTRKVAKSASIASKDNGIVISRKALKRWLDREDVKQQIIEGNAVDVESALSSLAFIVEGQEAENRLQCAKIILQLILKEYQREISPNDAVVLGTQWLSKATAVDGEKTREVISTSTEQILDKFDTTLIHRERAIAKLHPWRQETAKQMLDIWPELAEFIVALTSETDRSQVLTDWANTPPRKLLTAPAAIWCWFGTIAEDYSARNAALKFFKKGVAEGVTHPSYWAGRAALLSDSDETDALRQLNEYAAQLGTMHAITTACIAIAEQKYDHAIFSLEQWAPDDPGDAAIKSKLLARCLAALDDINGSIAALEISFAENNNADEIALIASRSLIWRSQQRQGANNLADLTRAGDLAISARDLRRAWGGDSTEAAQEAIKACILSNDADRAWRITQAPPLGEASFHESNDKRLRIEAAFISASKGEFELARDLITEIDDPFVSAYINGWIEFGAGQPEKAASNWFKAWEDAGNDFDHLRSASALAPLGAGLPDIEDLSVRFPEAVAELVEVHRIMSKPGEKIALLRARSGESKLLDSLLAEQLSALGKYNEAAQVLSIAATKWNSSQLMIMAAHEYFKSSDYVLSEKAANEAVSMSAHASTGEASALLVRFEALEALGQTEDSLRIARRMIADDPHNENKRWILVQALARDGSYEAAWNALNHNGIPIDPRNQHDAEIWIFLSSQFDTNPSFVSRSLRLIEERKDDKDLVGRFLANTVLAAGNATESDKGKLQRTIDVYSSENPESRTFRTITSTSPEDLLDTLRVHFRNNQPTSDFLAYEKAICEGKLPIGLSTLLFQKSYAEASISRVARRVFSHVLVQNTEISLHIQSVLGKQIALDTTAAVTLALLNPDVQDQLIGSFSVLKSTTPIYKDALEAQQSFRRRSTMTIGWNDENQELVTHTITDEEAERLVRHSDATVKILKRAHHKSWPRLKALPDYEGNIAWLTALDLAIENQVAFWCDDYSLRSLARELNVITFGTVDLIRTLTKNEIVTVSQRAESEAVLIANYHVDIDSELSVWMAAAESDEWRPSGAASFLTRPAAWKDTKMALKILSEAIKNNSEGSSETIEIWAFFAAHGVMSISGGSKESKAHNLCLLLNYCLGETQRRLDIFSHTLLGIRKAFTGDSEITDPLECVLEKYYSQSVKRVGPAIARSRLLDVTRHLSEIDKLLPAKIIQKNSSI